MGIFENLYNTVFPWLGMVFGGLSTLAETPTYTALEWLFGYGDTALKCVNMFSGVTFDYFSILGNIGAFGDFLTVILTPIYQFFVACASILGMSSAPFWLFLLVCIPSLVVIFALIRWVVDLVK